MKSKGKAAIVTGAASGIGREIALLYGRGRPRARRGHGRDRRAGRTP
jgi:NAD(P)-dependent dehydrogenase (short-subunit alcohol dehydrogenase family)